MRETGNAGKDSAEAGRQNVVAESPSRCRTHQLEFSGALLTRGFWLYVWEITTKDGSKVYYVGRTGDSSSVHAQSPFARLSQHLGRNEKSNALRRNLENHKLVAEECQTFRLLAYGPIFPEASTMAEHRHSRDLVAGLEKALADALRSAGYIMLNDVKCRKPLDPRLWVAASAVFTEHMPNLRDRTFKAEH